MKNTSKFLSKLLIVFALLVLFVTFYFLFFFAPSFEAVTLRSIFKIITQFALVISIPASVLFVLVDSLMEKIETKWILYLVRVVVFLGLMYVVSLFFSLYLISSSLLENPFKE